MTPDQIAALQDSHLRLLTALKAIISAKGPLERANAIKDAKEAIAHAEGQ